MGSSPDKPAIKPVAKSPFINVRILIVRRGIGLVYEPQRARLNMYSRRLWNYPLVRFMTDNLLDLVPHFRARGNRASELYLRMGFVHCQPQRF